MPPLLKNNVESKNYRPFFVLFSLAIGARIFHIFWIDEPVLFYKYIFFAQKIVGGEDIGERIVDLSPFYLHFVVIFKMIFGTNWFLLKWIQSMIGVLNCLLVFAVGRRLFNNEIAFFGALIFAAYGNLIVLESTLEPTVFVIFFNLLSVYFIYVGASVSANRRTRTAGIMAAGFFSGISVITKPSFLLFLPLGVVFILDQVGRPFRWKNGIGTVFLFLGMALVVIMPVTLRNYVKLNDFVLVTADAGKVFFHGNAIGATALEWTGLPDEGFREEGTAEPDYAHVLFRQTASRISGKNLSPSESSKFWMKRTFQDIAADPWTYLKRLAKKFVFFFTDYEMHYIASAYKEYKSSLQFPYLRYGVITSLAVVGMVLSAGCFRQRSLAYALVVLYLASGMMFIVQSRYRIPAVPYLCLFAASTIFYTKEYIRLKNWKRISFICISIAIIYNFSYLSFSSEIKKSDKWQQATKIYYQLGAIQNFSSGRYQAAVADLDASIHLAPNFGPAYNLRGKARAVLGKNQAAFRDFKKVISLSPNVAAGYRNIGLLHLLEGDREAARGYLTIAQTLDPDDKKIIEALTDLGR